MALDPVPTWIHGAKHSGDILRSGTYNQTNGAEGVTSPTAFQVRATETPSEFVRVAPGGLLMLSPWDENQTYTMRNASETLVEVPASSSLGANTWYINAWVNDPNKPGGTEPESKAFGPYNFLTCDAEPKGNNPAYACAKIDVPKNEATITKDMITDLRKLAQPGRWPFTLGRPLTAMDTDRELSWSVADGGEYFPGGGGSFNVFEVDVPKRATAIQIHAGWTSVFYRGGTNPHGEFWIEYGDEYRPHTWPGNRQLQYGTQKMAFNSPGSSNDNSRDNWLLWSTQSIPKKLRGKRIMIAFKAGRNDSGPADAVLMEKRSGLGAEITFVETILDIDQDEAI